MKRACTSSMPGALRLRQRQRLGLVVVVAQHQRGDVVGHLGQQLVALLRGQVAVGHDLVEQDLDVDLVVGAVDAGRVVDRVGVDAPARAARTRSRPRWVQPEVAALADDLAAQLGAVDAHARRWPGRRRRRASRVLAFT